MDKINLICLPFAGGSKYSYKGLADAAPRHINVIPIELPGRGSRFKEALLTDLDSMVEDVFSQIKEIISEPYAIYGHSMGSLIGYLLTKKIIKEGLNKPLTLFFTGCVGPSVREHENPPTHLLPRDQFFEKLKEFGGSPDEVLNDMALMNFFEPILKADFQAVDSFRYQDSEPFDIPIFVIIGLNEKATLENALAWQKETTTKVEVRQFPGKHFFIFSYEKEIMKIIDKKLNAQILL